MASLGLHSDRLVVVAQHAELGASPVRPSQELTTASDPAPADEQRSPMQDLLQGGLSRRAMVVGGASLACALASSWGGRLAPSTESTAAPSSLGAPDPGKVPAPAAPGPQAVESQVVIDAEADVPAAPAKPAWRLRLVRREAWTEMEPADNHNPMGSVQAITVHHTGADTRALGATDMQTVQRIDAYHREERGWACIGYHFLVGHHGLVYEGRPLRLQGAHVRDCNEANIGIACIGAFDSELPSEAQLASLTGLIGMLQKRTGLDNRVVFGHRDLSPSTCPGDALYAWLQQHYHGPAFG